MEETLNSDRGDYLPLDQDAGHAAETPSRAAAEGGVTMSEAVSEQLPDIETQVG